MVEGGGERVIKCWTPGAGTYGTSHPWTYSVAHIGCQSGTRRCWWIACSRGRAEGAAFGTE
eukprot:scaffold11316_cov112-Isochrysis_galbana.AAC.2